MPKTQFQAQQTMNTGRGTAAAAWTPWLAFYVGDPTAGGVEVVGNGYVRQQVSFGAPSGFTQSNSAVVTFPTPTGPWGGSGVALTHAALLDASVGGNVRYTYQLGGTDAERTVAAGSQPPSFGVGAIVWSEL